PLDPELELDSEPEPETPKQEKPEKTSVPKTDDRNRIFLWIVTMGLSAAVLAAGWLQRKER
ncbi:MAG: hypothetical protein IJ443_07095, partial [Firmicutes bacterium]|nr:hypothetical protein [Bacillota bacterium]